MGKRMTRKRSKRKVAQKQVEGFKNQEEGREACRNKIK